MGQLTALVEAICKDFRGHDEGEIRRLVEWQRVMKTQGQHMPLLRVHGPLDGLFVKNGPHRAIPGHAMSARGNIKIGKNQAENTFIHPHTENDSRSPAYLCT
ncbi:MAG: hypothetical protein MSK32_04140 [Paraprevotella sp.]|nr:hypothetical protein [Paraprevotella sp.]